MKQILATLQKTYMVAFAVLLVVFFAGAFAGIAFEQVRRRDLVLFRGPPDPGGGFVSAAAPAPDFPPMFEELDLTSEQRKQVDAVLERRRRQTDTLMRSTMPRLRAITDSMRAEIAAVLTPAQRTRLDVLMPIPPADEAEGMLIPAPVRMEVPAPPPVIQRRR